jgi:hypothetical protein
MEHSLVRWFIFQSFIVDMIETRKILDRAHKKGSNKAIRIATNSVKEQEKMLEMIAMDAALEGMN